MPMPSEHLATAESLGARAVEWLTDGQLELAGAYRDMAALHLNLAQVRHAIIGDTPPFSRPAPPLPDWCGACEGPDLNMRWISVDGPDGGESMRRCPDCNPYPHGTDVPRQAETGPSSGRDNDPVILGDT